MLCKMAQNPCCDAPKEVDEQTNENKEKNKHLQFSAVSEMTWLSSQWRNDSRLFCQKGIHTPYNRGWTMCVIRGKEQIQYVEMKQA